MRIRTRRSIAFLTAFLLLGVLIAGCGGSKSGSTPSSSSTSGSSTSGSSTSGSSTSGSSTSQAPAGPQKGGILKVAIIGEPPTIDMHSTTATIAFEVGWHIFETLYTYTAGYDIQPMLAEKMPDIAEAGKIYTVKLRQGVKFHNGKEMTADDVVASANRWSKIAQNAKGVLTGLKSITAKDKYTVEFAFDKPNGALLVGLATPGNGMSIYPKEIVDKFPDKKIEGNENYIGTGPYKLVEWVPDRYIKMQRFDQYAARSEEPNGPGGKKNAYADELRFIPVPDVNTRLAGLESGEYDVAAVLSGTQLETVKGNSNLQAVTVKPVSYLNFNFNTIRPPFNNKLVRQAALAVMDADQIMAAAFGHKDMYRIDASLMQVEQKTWYTDAGKELYNQKNLQKAKDLLAKSGYKGEKIRFMATKEYDYNYKGSLVYSELLKAAGFNIELVISDWATLVANRAKPDVWEIYGTGISLKNNPLLLAPMGDKWFTNWQDPKRTELVGKIAGEVDDAKAAVIWKDLQKLVYEEAPWVKVGDYFALRAARKNIGGVPTMSEYYFWNTHIIKK